MNNIDYHWPVNKIPPPNTYVEGNKKNRKSINDKLEYLFTEYFGFPSIVLPSGRSALSLALQVCIASRQHLIIHAPRFSSPCVWNILGRFADPTMRVDKNTNLILAVHKYGITYRLKHTSPTKLIIEDSCDSLVTHSKSLFPNSGKFEIFSLPKIMGIYSGGILVCADQYLANEAKYISSETAAISNSQGYLRWGLASSGSISDYNVWDANEYHNLTPDYTLLQHILEHFDKLSINQNTIESRLAKLNTYYPEVFSNFNISLFDSRLPPVLAINNFSDDPKLMKRHINSTPFIDKPNFVEMALIPLHFGVDETFFEEITKKIAVTL